MSEVGEDRRYERAPLLLHSLAEFGPLLRDLLAATETASVMEVGAEDGLLTRYLLDTGDHLTVHAVDPRPSEHLLALAAERPQLRLHATTGAEAIRQVTAVDTYLIDGDHNYWTVTSELKAITARAGAHDPLLILHDVGWPCGRRDTYYNPDAVPVGHRQPLTYDRGVRLDDPATVDGGFRGEGAFAVAIQEGGPRNGVLTALEDMLEPQGWTWVVVPCVFGLAVAFHPTAPWRDAVERVLAPFESVSWLLQKLERNRLRLYLALLDAQDELARRPG
jgi:hypothetical protein